MSRLQKKCFVASIGLHGLLLVVLVVAPALTKAPDKTASGGGPPVMELIPAPKALAGNPIAIAANPTPPATPTRIEEPTPPPPPPPPVPRNDPPKQKEPVKEPEHKSPIVEKRPTKDAEIPTVAKKPDAKPPKKQVAKKESPKNDPKKEVAKSKEPDPPKTEPKKTEPKIKIADTGHLVKRDSDEAAKKAATAAAAAADAKANADAAKAAQASRVAKLDGTIGGLRSSLSNSLNIQAVGTNPAAFANYGQQVVNIYEENWLNKPEDVTDDSVIVHVSVTILRDGSVKDAHIVRASGKASVDRSVKQTLDRVTRFPRFPEGSTDAERTFNIDFNLKTSKRIG